VLRTALGLANAFAIRHPTSDHVAAAARFGRSAGTQPPAPAAVVRSVGLQPDRSGRRACPDQIDLRCVFHCRRSVVTLTVFQRPSPFSNWAFFIEVDGVADLLCRLMNRGATHVNASQRRSDHRPAFDSDVQPLAGFTVR
jgi:hypothetical protein